MGFTTGTEQITVHTITGDGQGGYWWMAVANGQAYSGGYNAGTETTKVAEAPIHGRNTFKQLIQAMIQNNIGLPPHDMNINVEDAADRHGLHAQFEAPALTDSEVGIIFNHFDPVEICVKFGVFRLVQRGYLLGHISLPQLSQIFIELGRQGKGGSSQNIKQKIENATQWLLNNNHITQSQYSDFWTTWDNQVGT